MDSFSFDMLPSLEDGEWMLRLTSLEGYKTLFIITTENIKYQLHRSKEEKGLREH